MPVTAETAFRLAEDLRQENERCAQREALMIGAMLMGRGGTLLGMPVGITVTWPEGRPFGWSEEQLREYGETIFTRAGGTL